MNTIVKRNGDIVPFSVGKIEKAIQNAFKSSGVVYTSEEVEQIEKCVISKLKEKSGDFEITTENLSMEIDHSSEPLAKVEEIQDIVEKCLMEFNKYEVLRHYILFREEKNQEREKIREKTENQFERNTLKVKKENGKLELFDIKKVENSFLKHSKGYEELCSFEELKEKLKGRIINKMPTSELNETLMRCCLDLVNVNNTHWQYIAARYLLGSIYKKARNNRWISQDSEIYTPENYLKLFKTYVEEGLYYKNFFEHYSEEDVLKAGKYIKSKRDFSYIHTTVNMLNKRYLLNPNKYVRELPQEMYMSVALFLATNEKEGEKLNFALKLYDAISTQKISLPTPTLLNSRTNFHQLSSCFKMSIDDDLRAIYHSIENMAQISKYGGGIGVYLGNLRSKGSYIRWVKGAGGGVNPWIKVINDTAIAVNQLGARAGAISVTLDVWHRDIESFLEIQTENGDIRTKSYDIFPSVSFPDLFMERVKENGKWTLFDPYEIKMKTGKKLQDKFGEEFEKFYIELENRGDLELKEVVDAKELYKQYLQTVVETGKPYSFFRDTVNRLNPNKHAGSIYSTQLCVSGDTKITIEDENWKRNIAIQELENINISGWNIKVLSKDIINNKNEFCTIKDFACTNKEAEVIEIEDSETGKKIICTPEHKIFTSNRGYVKAIDLREDDILSIN